MRNPQKHSSRRHLRFPLSAGRYVQGVAAGLAVVMGACGCASSEGTGQRTAHEDTQQLAEDDHSAEFRIGLVMNSPGMVTGTDPQNTSGAEVAVARAVIDQVQSISEGNITWVSVSAGTETQALESGEVQLLVGRQGTQQLADSDAQWAGPYAITSAGLLVREDTGPENFEVISDEDDLAEANVCIVAGSLADVEDFPAEQSIHQATYLECGIGLRAGRFDAVAGDLLPLAGLSAAPEMPGDNYTVVEWAEWDLPAPVRQETGYWIGVAPDSPICPEVASSVASLGFQNELDHLLHAEGIPGSFTPQSPDPGQFTATECDFAVARSTE